MLYETIPKLYKAIKNPKDAHELMRVVEIWKEKKIYSNDSLSELLEQLKDLKDFNGQKKPKLSQEK